MDIERLRMLSGRVAEGAEEIQSTPYAYERNLAEDDKTKASRSLEEARDAILRLMPVLHEILGLIDAECPRDVDGEDKAPLTLEDATKILSEAMSNQSVQESLFHERYHENFPEDYVDGDVDMGEEAEDYRWGFNALYYASRRILSTANSGDETL